MTPSLFQFKKKACDMSKHQGASCIDPACNLRPRTLRKFIDIIPLVGEKNGRINPSLGNTISTSCCARLVFFC